MIPIDQTTFGFPGGNCFSACVASILELPITLVPYFMADWPEMGLLKRWLAEYGLYEICLGAQPDWYPCGYSIAGGQSPRGPHSVVAFGKDVVHDPHPSRDGIERIEDWTLIIPIDGLRCTVPKIPHV